MSPTPIVVGLSYRTAPLTLLEQAAMDPQSGVRLAMSLVDGGISGDADEVCVHEAMVLSTCNRLEVYAGVDRFHNGLASIGQSLAVHCGVPLSELTPHLYVHYERSAVEHLFSVAAGLDSMAVGEQQILGQVRAALREAQQAGTVSRVLQPLLQQALRVGKQVHTDTDLDRAGTSLVAAGLAQADRLLGGIDQASVLVLGAGAMGGLAVAGVQRAGAARLIVLSRTLDRAERLADAARSSIPATAVPAVDLDGALAEADVVLSCTGALGYLVEPAKAKSAAAQRHGKPQVYLDLALPRDVDPDVADIDSVHLIDLERLGQILAEQPIGAEIDQARQLVADEVMAYLSAVEAEQVAPTVVALRAKARDVVAVEIERLRSRLGSDADPRVLAELEQSVHRVVDKILHTPTVRVKELAGAPNGSAYAIALRELFDLDLGLPAAVIGRSVGESDAEGGVL